MTHWAEKLGILSVLSLVLDLAGMPGALWVSIGALAGALVCLAIGLFTDWPS